MLKTKHDYSYTKDMEDRTKTIAAISILLGLALLIIVIVGVVVTGKKVVSPIPGESAIKIIFISPTPEGTTPSVATSTPTIKK